MPHPWRDSPDTGTHAECEVAEALQQARDQFACNPSSLRAWLRGGVSLELLHPARLFDKACLAGDSNACAHAGTLLLDKKRQALRSKGIDKLRASCDAKIAWSCIHLGNAYRIGTKIEADLSHAESFLRQGCRLDHHEGCVLLGKLLDRKSASGSSGLTEAASLFRKACDRDVQAGCVKLGDLYTTGRGVAQDFKKAASLFEPACNRYVGGCMRIGKLYQDGDGVAKDAAKANQFFARGCANQDPNACIQLAKEEWDQEDPRNLRATRKATQQVKRQCRRGHALSCQVSAGWSAVIQRRRQLCKRACMLGRLQACQPSCAAK